MIIAPGQTHLRADVQGLLLDRRVDLRVGQNGRPARPQHTSLLTTDGRQRIAQPVTVIEADRTDDRGVRIDDVDRIEPAA